MSAKSRTRKKAYRKRCAAARRRLRGDLSQLSAVVHRYLDAYLPPDPIQVTVDPEQDIIAQGGRIIFSIAGPSWVMGALLEPAEIPAS